MSSTTLRVKLLWLIAGRAAVVTLLLGSAILIQLKSPGALPIDPFFFFLIGVTYALTAIYSLGLKYTERNRWLVDVQLAFDAILVSAHRRPDRRRDELLTRRSTRCRSSRPPRSSRGAAA